jgi:hypothetical protein
VASSAELVKEAFDRPKDNPMTESSVSLVKFWSLDQRLTFFLACLVLIIFVILPLAGLGILGKFVVDLVLSMLMISGVIATRRSLALKIFVASLTIGGLIFHWTNVYVLSQRHPVLDSLLLMLCLFAFAAITLMQLFSPGPVNLNRVLGAIAAYLLIGLMWAYAYRLTDLKIPGSLRFVGSFADGEAPMARYVYFSFTTLTTIGYGDVLPAHPLSRMLAVSEALTGQLYPAVLIGGLLAMALQSRVQRDER